MPVEQREGKASSCDLIHLINHARVFFPCGGNVKCKVPDVSRHNRKSKLLHLNVSWDAMELYEATRHVEADGIIGVGKSLGEALFVS